MKLKSLFVLLIVLSFVSNKSISQTTPNTYLFENRQYLKLGTVWKYYNSADETFYNIDNEIVTVKFGGGVTPSQRESFATNYGLTYSNNTLSGWYDYKINSNEILPLVMTIKDLPIIQKVIINQIVMQTSTIPNDPMCQSTNTNFQNYLNNIEHFNALSLMPTVNGEGGCNTIVAVIDNGFNINEPELYDPTNNVNQIWHNDAEDDWTTKSDPNSGNGVDDDGNGFIDDWQGWNFGGTANSNGDNNPAYPSTAQIALAHGAPVSGIIGAKANNNNLMAGIAGGFGVYNGVKLMQLKIGDNVYGHMSTVYLKYALQYARLNYARIINLTISYADFDQSVEDELENCYNANIFIVGSSGNELIQPLWKMDYYITYPALSKYVFSVGASEADDTRWWRSCYTNKPQGLDLVAPGGSHWINTIDNNGNIFNDGSGGGFGGTSAAAPMVAATAANMICLNSCLSNKSISEILRSSADKVGNPNAYGNSQTGVAGHSDEYGFGRLNEMKALQAVNQYFVPSLDLYMKDCEDDYGIEYTATSNYACLGTVDETPDIWVRNQDDGILNPVHQDPIYGTLNYIYVRVRNRSCVPSVGGGTETLNVYWSKGATFGAWPANFDGSIPNLGNIISTENLPVINSGDYTIVKIPWTMPTIIGLNAPIGAINFCIMARINASADPIHTINFLFNLEAPSNNVALRNMATYKSSFMPPRGPIVLNDPINYNPGYIIDFGNPRNSSTSFDLIFDNPNLGTYDICEEAQLTLVFDTEVWPIIYASGSLSQAALEVIEPRVVKIKNCNFTLSNITLPANSRYGLHLGVNYLIDSNTNKKLFYRIRQHHLGDSIDDGAMNIVFDRTTRVPFEANAGNNQVVFANTPITINANSINEDVNYYWYNENGTLINTGQTISTTFSANSKVRLEVTSALDGYKDIDSIDITIKSGEIQLITPNPATSNTNVYYQTNNTTNNILILTNGTANYVFTLNNSIGYIPLDLSAISSGVYNILLVCDGTISDIKQLLKN